MLSSPIKHSNMTLEMAFSDLDLDLYNFIVLIAALRNIFRCCYALFLLFVQSVRLKANAWIPLPIPCEHGETVFPLWSHSWTHNNAVNRSNATDGLPIIFLPKPSYVRYDIGRPSFYLHMIFSVREVARTPALKAFA